MDLKLWNWDWDQESYPASSDFWVLIFFAPFFLFLRFILDRFIFEVTLLVSVCFPPLTIRYDLGSKKSLMRNLSERFTITS